MFDMIIYAVKNLQNGKLEIFRVEKTMIFVEKQFLLKRCMKEVKVLMKENLQKWRQNHGRL